MLEIGTILNICSLMWLILMMLSIGKREYISASINKGVTCPSCKEDFDVKTYEDFKKLGGRRLCTNCKRDEILDSFLNRKLKIIDFTKYKKWWLIFTLTNLTAVILNVISMFTTTFKPELSFIAGSLLFTSNMFNYIHFRQTTRRKNKKTQS